METLIEETRLQSHAWIFAYIPKDETLELNHTGVDVLLFRVQVYHRN